jgi:ankyrin repeat protein
MSKIKTFDPDEFLFDLYAMSSTEVETLFLEELNKDKPHLEKIKIIIDSGLLDLKAKDNYGLTPLHWASRYNLIETAKLLLDAGANLEDKNKWGGTPLHMASANNHIETAKLLIERGADLEAKNVDGLTPLHLASLNNHIEIAKLLLERGADSF